MSLKIAILASGSGTNAENIIRLSQCGQLKASVELVIANRPKAAVLQKAKDLGINAILLDHDLFKDRQTYDRRLQELINEANCSLVVLAGYMRLLGEEFLQAFSGRVLNIHPAILPAFPGLHGARDALDYGVKISGATVHFVEVEMDRGPVIIQAAVPVRQTDDAQSLQNRIHLLEYRIYPQAIQWFADGRLRLNGRTVALEPFSRGMPDTGGDCLVWPPLEEGF